MDKEAISFVAMFFLAVLAVAMPFLFVFTCASLPVFLFYKLWNLFFPRLRLRLEPPKLCSHIVRNIILLFITFLSVICCYDLFGPATWESRRFNREIRTMLAKGQDVDLSALLELECGKASFLIVPAYISIKNVKDWNCEGYNNDFLEKLDIQSPMHDDALSLIVFDEKGLKKEIDSSTYLFCDRYAQRLCLKLDDAKLSISNYSDKPCFRISSKSLDYLLKQTTKRRSQGNS